MSRLAVLTPGPSTTVQDVGRPGHAHEGVSPSGWLDGPAARLANRLVGNPPETALLETTLTGPALRLDGPAVRFVALTGAPAPLRVGGRPAALCAPVAVRPGERIEVGTADPGLRSYLAVSGGVAVAPTLGSRSTDLLGGLGPPPLNAGDMLPLGPPARPAAIDVAPVAAIDPLPTLAIVPGPRDDWLTENALDTLNAETWSVSDRCNRIGVRLTGARLHWARDRELASEGMVSGAIQVPPSGEPVILLADHPVTGGYPVIAVLRAGALAAAGQLRPGGGVRFRVGGR